MTARVFARLGGEPAALVHTTVAATMLDGGTAANVLPSQAVGDAQPPHRRRRDRRVGVAHVRRVIRDPAGGRRRSSRAATPRPSRPPTTPQFAAIAAAVGGAYPEATTAPYLMMAATDSRYFHRFSPAVYRFAPLAMTAAQRAAIHGVDESVTIDSLERGERFHRALITVDAGLRRIPGRLG